MVDVNECFGNDAVLLFLCPAVHIDRILCISICIISFAFASSPLPLSCIPLPYTATPIPIPKSPKSGETYVHTRAQAPYPPSHLSIHPSSSSSSSSSSCFKATCITPNHLYTRYLTHPFVNSAKARGNEKKERNLVCIRREKKARTTPSRPRRLTHDNADSNKKRRKGGPEKTCIREMRKEQMRSLVRSSLSGRGEEERRRSTC